MQQDHRSNGSSADLLSLASYLSAHVRFLVWGALLVLLGSRALLQLKDAEYEARATFAPSSPSASDLSAIGGALGGFAASLGVLGSGQQGAKFYADLAQSDVVILSAVDTLAKGVAPEVPRFDYAAVNELKADSAPALRDVVLRHVKKNLNVEFDARTSVVAVSFVSHDPKLSFAMAHALTAALDRFNVELLQRTARSRTRFLEDRLEELRAERRASEVRLSEFLQGNRQYQLSPPLVLRQTELRQDFETKNANLVSLQSTLDKSRIDEMRDTPVLMMLESPMLPVTPSGPRRTLLALQLAFLWVFLGTMFFAVRAVVAHMASHRPSDYRTLSSNLRRFLPRAAPTRVSSRDSAN